MWYLNDNDVDDSLLDIFEFLSSEDKTKFLLYYIIGNLYCNSENYERSIFLGLDPLEFTTCDKIYKETGIYAIVISKVASKMLYSFIDLFDIEYFECDDDLDFLIDDCKINLKEFHYIKIIGNSDILINFESLLNPYFLVSKSIHENIDFEVLGLGNNNMLCWDDLIYENVKINDFNSLITDKFIHRVKSRNVKYLFFLLKEVYDSVDLDKDFKKFPVLYIDNLSDYIHLCKGMKVNDSYMFDILDSLTMYFESIYILYTFCYKEDVKYLKSELKKLPNYYKIKVLNESKYQKVDVYSKLILGSLLVDNYKGEYEY